LNFSVENVLTNPTICSLARLSSNKNISDIKYKPKPFEMLNISDISRSFEGVENVYPLSVLQQALVYLSESNPNYQIYVTTYQIKARLNLSFYSMLLVLQQKTSNYAYLL